MMNLDWRAAGVLVIGALVLYVMATRTAKAAVVSIGEGARALSDAVFFDPASLGPDLTLTPAAQDRAAWYIDRGYGYIDAGGVFRLTPAGVAYANTVTTGSP